MVEKKKNTTLRNGIILIITFLLGALALYGVFYFFPNVIGTTVTKLEKDVTVTDEGIADVKVIMNGSQTHFESGNHRKIYKFSLNITTNNNNVYYIRFNYDYENPFNTKTLGVNRMLIMDENNNIILLIENEI